jgi:hypothetical protein
VASNLLGQKEHVEALVLAFSNSRAKSLVGTDALRTVVSGQYRELVQDGALHLEGVWGLLESQPGFDPEMVKPPLCRYKLWQDDLGIDIVLPEALSKLDPLEIRSCAERCRVPELDLDKVLGRGRYTDQERAARASRLADADSQVSEPVVEAPKQSRPILLVAAFLVALASFGVTGFFLWQAFTRPPADKIAVTFAPGIPLAKAERRGIDVGATLSDDGWLGKADVERRSALTTAIETLRRDGVRTLYIRDKKGKVRALAQSYDKGTKVRIQFF